MKENELKKAILEFAERKIHDEIGEGEILIRKNDRYQKDKLYKIYSTKKCKTCIYHDKCTKSRVREILEDAHPLRLKLRKDYLTTEGQKYYKKKEQTTEKDHSQQSKQNKRNDHSNAEAYKTHKKN